MGLGASHYSTFTPSFIEQQCTECLLWTSAIVKDQGSDICPHGAHILVEGQTINGDTCSISPEELSAGRRREAGKKRA